MSLSLSILYIFLTGVLSLLTPYIIRIAIDNIKMNANQRYLLIFSGAILGVAIIQGLFRFFMRKILIGTSRKIEYSLRIDLFEHIQTLDSSYFIENKTGAIMAVLTNDLDAVRTVIGPGILNFFNTVFVFFSTLTVMFLINYKLALYSLIAIPLLPLIVFKLSAVLHERSKKSQEQYAAVSAKTQESFAGIKVVQSFNRQENEIEDFKSLNSEFIKRNLSLARIRALFWPVMILIGGTGSLLVLFVGGRQVINSEISIGEFVQFSAYIISITWPLISLGWVINLVQRGSASMGRINEILNKKPAVSPVKADREDKILLKDSGVKFDNVCFSYPNNKFELKNISFEIGSGATLGITGYTGSGKSTIINLLAGLYTPNSGEILIGAINLKKMPAEVLRQAAGFITQEPFLFSKTIKENIIYGKEDLVSEIPAEEIEQKVIKAATAAMLHDEIKGFPFGYETIIGERGITLSGGQRQRLAIARALFKDPSILVFDDAFSSVDTQTEEMIIESLKSAAKDITKIIISHRISAVKNSSLILVLDEGEIKESGTHQQLLKVKGIYYKLYKIQQLSLELDDEIEEMR